MASMNKSPPNKAATDQDPSDISPQPRVASGTLPPQAAHAPEFVPGEQKTSEAGSDKELASRKKPKALMKAEKKAEKRAKEKAQKQKALDEEWWSGDEVFVPDLKDKDDFENDEQI